MLKKVSVVVPTYNHREYVREAIQSILDQTCPEYEIVVEDGSQDVTARDVARFGDHIRYLWRENRELSVA